MLGHLMPIRWIAPVLSECVREEKSLRKKSIDIAMKAVHLRITNNLLLTILMSQ